MEKILQKMLFIDRRFIYLVLATALVISLIFGKALTPTVMPPAENLFTAINNAKTAPADEKIILVGMTFSMGTMGENANQARAIIRHLMIAKKRFAIISIAEPQGAQFSMMIVEDLAKQYNYKYGVDWISWGYQLSTLATYKGIAKDIPNTIKVDVNGKPLKDFPIMQGIKSANNLAMEVEVTASASVGAWITLVQPATRPRMPIGYACTGIMATEAYPFLDSGQLIGMLPGLKGAADYELMVDRLEQKALAAGTIKALYDADPKKQSLKLPTIARQLMTTQGVAHMVILAFILFGNIVMIMTKFYARKNRQQEGGRNG